MSLKIALIISISLNIFFLAGFCVDAYINHKNSKSKEPDES